MSFLTSGDRSLKAAQIRSLRQTLGLHAGGSLLWPFALGWTFSTDGVGPLSLSTILIWNGLLFAWGVGAVILLMTTLRRLEDADLARAERTLIGFYLLNSVLWVLLPFMMWVPGNPHNNYFVILIMISNTLFIFQLAFHRTVFLTMLAPGLCALTVKLFLDGADYLLPFAAMGPLFLGWAASLGLQLNGQIIEAIRTGLNNRALAEDLSVARDEAVRQKRAADEANAAKSSFLATMSHELRTPLNAIIGFGQIIRLKMLGEDAIDKYANYAGDIEDSGKHLLGLINQILDLAKIESGAVAFSLVEFDLAPLIEECARTMRVKADEKGIALTIEGTQAAVPVRADEMAVRQVVLNLLSNAVKFTQAGSVRVLVSQQNDVVEIAFKDSGCGIAAEHMQRIFQPFEQVDNSLSRQHGGTGLGLPIVAKLVQAHGGTCRVDSVVNEGSCFSVRLPIGTGGLRTAA